MNPIAATSAVSNIGQTQGVGQGRSATQTVSKGSFGDLVNQFIEKTNQAQVSSDVAISDFATGKTDNVQQVVLAMANADMSFQLFMEIRNQIIDSYNELMRMQF